MLPSGTICMHLAKVKILYCSFYSLIVRYLGDYTTRHAGMCYSYVSISLVLLSFFFLACPVLIGNKWVGNKWIHERGQEFRRRCSLDPME